MTTPSDHFIQLSHAVASLRHRHDDRGASLVEYALLIALIAIVCIAALTLLGGNASSTFNSTASSLG
ncbi:MAG TPA: Flp family type IVb pilin [Acidimicrobiales bacterium]|jgi:pilus assembly protein Flp/PilA|nr:Flp family type IVb pilin [Acidimicrobiales bacterium]